MTQHRLYVGTYTRAAPHVPRAFGRGIYALDFNVETGALGAPSLAAELPNPSFLASHGKALYAVSEQGEGMLSAFALEGEGLRFLNAQPTGGRDAAFVSVDARGRFALVANYGGGAAVAAFPLRQDGSLGNCAASARHAGSGPNPERQQAPHPHAILPDPDGKFAYAPDLGTDEVVIYRLGGPDAPLRRAGAAKLPSGSGPRHIAFHPNGALAFVTLELSSGVASLRHDPTTGDLELSHPVSAQPPDFHGANSPAEILVSPDGRFVYASNRGHDSLGGWEVDEGTGELKLVGFWPTLGKTPRSFTSSPDGAFVLVGNQDSESIAVFPRDAGSGKLGEGKLFPCPTPACLRFGL